MQPADRPLQGRAAPVDRNGVRSLLITAAILGALGVGGMYAMNSLFDESSPAEYSFSEPEGFQNGDDALVQGVVDRVLNTSDMERPTLLVGEPRSGEAPRFIVLGVYSGASVGGRPLQAVDINFNAEMFADAFASRVRVLSREIVTLGGLEGVRFRLQDASSVFSVTLLIKGAAVYVILCSPQQIEAACREVQDTFEVD